MRCLTEFCDTHERYHHNGEPKYDLHDIDDEICLQTSPASESINTARQSLIREDDQRLDSLPSFKYVSSLPDHKNTCRQLRRLTMTIPRKSALETGILEGFVEILAAVRLMIATARTNWTQCALV